MEKIRHARSSRNGAILDQVVGRQPMLAHSITNEKLARAGGFDFPAHHGLACKMESPCIG